jgi:hypothetical protein
MSVLSVFNSPRLHQFEIQPGDRPACIEKVCILADWEQPEVLRTGQTT